MHHKLKIEVSSGNADVCSEHIANGVKRWMDTISDRMGPVNMEATLRDVNGNRIGMMAYAIYADEPEDQPPKNVMEDIL